MKAFVPLLARHVGIPDEQLVEQDVRLHFLLSELASDASFRSNAVFKGGTCLIKCYLDYPRFSIDLDFTWRLPRPWSSLGTKALRRELRPIQRALVDSLRAGARSQSVAFDPTRDLRYGQSNRMMTALLHYRTARRLDATIKFQVNFTEPLLFPVRRRKARSLLDGDAPPDLRAVDPALTDRYAAPIPVASYDAREILAEKGRAILTRQAAKARDLVDLFLMEETLGLRLEDHLDAVERKVEGDVGRVQRYAVHLGDARGRFEAMKGQDVRPLLLKEIDMQGFEAYRVRALRLLERVADGLDPGLSGPARRKPSRPCRLSRAPRGAKDLKGPTDRSQRVRK